MATKRTFRNIAIIYNPNSTGDAKSNSREMADTLGKRLKDTKVELLPTKRAGHAIELAYDFAKKHTAPLIISASGDGGYNEVINGALRAQQEGAKPVCAVLGSGNANDHARTMQDKPLSELIIEGDVKQIDILKVTTKDTKGKSKETVRYAHSYVGIGLTPTVAVELNKHTLNSFREALIILKTFWGYKPVTIRAGNKKHHVDSLIASTISGMAKVLTFSDTSKPHDGLFELTVFEHNRKIKLLFRLIKGAIHHLGTSRRLSSYSFSIAKPAPIQLDGEVMELSDNTNIDITICPRLLRTIV